MNTLNSLNASNEVKSAKKKDWWDELTEKQKEEIKIGLKQVENGEVIDFEDFIKKHL